MSGSSIANPEFKNYEDTQLGFSIKYPSNWTFKKFEGDPGIRFRSPPSTHENKVHDPNLVVRLESLQEFDGKSLEEVAAESFLSGFKTKTSQSYTLDGEPAVKIPYSRLQGKVLGFRICSIRNDTVYMLTYVSRDEDYSRFLLIIEEMINSFKVTGSVPNASIYQ